MAQSGDELKALLVPEAMRLTGDAASGQLIDVTWQGHHASISLFGAHLLHWRPAGHRPVLWLSDGAKFDQSSPIRGGIPICWPWFAGHPEHPDWISHGIARVTPWHLDFARESDRGIELQLSLPIEDWHAPYWPQISRPVLRYTVSDTLRIELQTKNVDPHSIEISQALHTYIAVSNTGATSIAGLEASPFIDKLTGIEQPEAGSPIIITAETDRIYRQLTAPIKLRDSQLNRTITIAHEGASNAIVWNPWIEKTKLLDDIGPSDAYRGFVCIETGNVAPDIKTLQPGETHTLKTNISVHQDD